MGRGKEVRELRDRLGMNRREFSDYYGICLLYTSHGDFLGTMKTIIWWGMTRMRRRSNIIE